MMPYLERFSFDMKYDVFWVVYVSGDSVVNLQCFNPHEHEKMLENEEDSREEQVI